LLDCYAEYGKQALGSKTGKAYLTKPVMRVDKRDAAGLMRLMGEHGRPFYFIHDPRRDGDAGGVPAGAAAHA
jgi:hypothetical protein